MLLGIRPSQQNGEETATAGGFRVLGRALLLTAAVSLDITCLWLMLILSFGPAEQKTLSPHACQVKMRTKG